MKRNDMIKRMVACFNECKKMDYSDQQAMDRVLELQEEDGMQLCVETFDKGYGEMSIGFEPDEEN